MRKWITAILIGAAMIGLTVVAAPAASAGGCRIYGTVCGRVTNVAGPTIQISNNWHLSGPAVLPAEKHLLAVGHNSWEYPAWKDTDALWSPSCFTIYQVYNQLTNQIVGSGPVYRANTWYKINDLTYARVRAHAC